jgi:hypothetical protein
MRSIWGWHDPLVVRLMQALVEDWMMETTMDPIYEKIGEHDKERELEKVVPQPWAIFGLVVHLAVSSYFCQEEWGSHQSHSWKRHARLLHLHSHLVFEVFWVIECGLIEDKYV